MRSQSTKTTVACIVCIQPMMKTETIIIIIIIRFVKRQNVKRLPWRWLSIGLSV